MIIYMDLDKLYIDIVIDIIIIITIRIHEVECGDSCSRTRIDEAQERKSIDSSDICMQTYAYRKYLYYTWIYAYMRTHPLTPGCRYATLRTHPHTHAYYIEEYIIIHSYVICIHSSMHRGSNNGYLYYI